MKKSWLIICLSVCGLLFAACCVSYFVYADMVKKDVEQTNQVLSLIQDENINPDAIREAYAALSDRAKEKEGELILETFFEVVEDAPYETDKTLVNIDSISLYKKYKTVAEILEVTSGEQFDYINLVLKLEQYDSYDALIECVNGTKNTYNNMKSKITAAQKEQKKGNSRLASQYISEALTLLRETDAVFEGNLDKPYCRDYFNLYVDLFGVLLSGGNLDGLDKIENTISRAESVANSVKDIQRKLLTN